MASEKKTESWKFTYLITIYGVAILIIALTTLAMTFYGDTLRAPGREHHPTWEQVDALEATLAGRERELRSALKDLINTEAELAEVESALKAKTKEVKSLREELEEVTHQFNEKPTQPSLELELTQ